ncbi:MAG TPA: NCS2 family permease [Deltaproteobacteria bacterium]|nr:NCS2 family permease [Deltaproteobacteria bacterium]
MEAIKRLFRLDEKSTTVGREAAAGVTTFAAMSYIIFVQPAVLGAAGMDFGAVMTATCLASAAATLAMGLLADYPIALAPAMGHNFFFSFTVVAAMGLPWRTALGAVFVSGVLFIALSLFHFRERLVNTIPEGLKHAIAAGIGLLIALAGLEWAGIVVDAPGTYVGLGSLHSPPVLLSLLGLAVTAALLALRVRTAVLLGMAVTVAAGLATGLIEYRGLVSAPPSLAPTFLELDIRGALGTGLLSVIFVFFFLDLFDTVGTLIGVGDEAGFIKDGRLPRARRAFLADALGTVTGALLGTSTVTSYIESAAGVSAGGRSGLASCFTAALFVAALFFSPLVEMVGGGIESGGARLYPVVAPVLIVVGSLMCRGAARIRWDDPTEALPAFLTMIMMPVTFSITEGIAFGIISHTLMKTAAGRRGEVEPLMALFALLFVLRYALLRG